jgi:hypothetical protein
MQRFKVVAKVPTTMRDLGFVAYVQDAFHPDGGALSVSWHQTVFDADRTANAMNMVATWRKDNNHDQFMAKVNS